jgi:putative ABC transport system ATP-binding protein
VSETNQENQQPPPADQAASPADEVFRLSGISRIWPGEPPFNLTVSKLVIQRGEKVALVGFSGCGKSTLLDLLAMVLRPDQAEEFVFSSHAGARVDVMEAWRRKKLDSLADTRLHHIGYVLQTGGLFPFLSVRDNIGISRQGLGLPADNTVEELAKRLNIERHLNKLPGQLSVGERQRVAIARSMAHQPSVVIADEPTASLDPINAGEIMKLFANLVDEYGVTLVMATHDWGRLGNHGFRRVEFDIQQDEGHGGVKAEVVG